MIFKPVPNYKKGRNGYKPEIVVIHIADGTMKGSYQEFSVKEKSSHYIVGSNGEVWQFVKEEDTAWANGNVYNPSSWIVKTKSGINPNLYSISIEHEDFDKEDISETSYQASGNLLKEICERWKIPLDREHIIGHNGITKRKLCPEKINIDRLIEIASKTDEVKIEELKKVQLSLLQQILKALQAQLKRLLGE